MALGAHPVRVRATGLFDLRGVDKQLLRVHFLGWGRQAAHNRPAPGGAGLIRRPWTFPRLPFSSAPSGVEQQVVTIPVQQ